MGVEIHDHDHGPWALVECGAWSASVFGSTSKVILTLKTTRGNVTLQHDADVLAELGPRVVELYGFALDAGALRNAIEAGKSALASAAGERAA